MRNNFTWIFFLILSCAPVWPIPVQPALHASDPRGQAGDPPDQSQEQVISVSITSSVAVGRGKGKPSRLHEHKHYTPRTSYQTSPVTESISTAATDRHRETEASIMPTAFAGANMEFIKQLLSKKESRGLQHFESIHSYATNIKNRYSNDTADSIAEPTSVLEVDAKNEETGENVENIPLARSVSLSASARNYIQGLSHKPISERGNNQRLTTMSFDIVHDASKATSSYNEPSDTYVTPKRAVSETPKYYNEPPKFYHEPAKVYSQPAQIYSEPAKFYSEPAKIYSEPAKIYSEPAKVYSEPAKIYSEPAKFYSQPASLHLPPAASDPAPWQRPAQAVSSTVVTSTPYTTAALPLTAQSKASGPTEHQPEKNYEVDEKISVLTEGRSHGVQESSTDSCKQENCKVGYVVEGRQYRKYRVEERTSDGFIVGEYGVVRHEDGALRGVRYTADGDASPRLIYDALMKFLQLK
ncbi:hypothetical protein O0L34_g11353 [Tuta absoluta]|nr:hypothetical protein O0L34_g11353 [Tuta absoluta]